MSKAHSFVASHAILPNDDKYEEQLQQLLASSGHKNTVDRPDGSRLHTFDDDSQAITRGCLDENDMDSFEALLLEELEEELESEDEDESEEA
jgi:hypothetical protein